MRLRNCAFAHIRASKSESVSEGEIVRRSERINRRRRREKKKRGNRTTHAVCESLGRKDGETERGKGQV